MHFNDKHSDSDEYECRTDNESDNRWKVKPSSKIWSPNVDPVVDLYVNNVKHEIISNLKKSKKMNLS